MGLFDKLFNQPNAKSSPGLIRDTLFGDLPLDLWPSDQGQPDEFPWASFISARRHVEASEIDLAKQCWLQIISTAGLESRHYAQAWYFLRQYGASPSAESSKTILGIVIEVGMPKGLDLLAAYPDYHARYYNFSGAGVIWEHPDTSLDQIIDRLFAAAASVVVQTGPWKKERPDPPTRGEMRISLLTPSGLHFGEAAIQALVADSLAAPVIHAGGQLLQALIGKHQPAQHPLGVRSQG